MLSSQRDSQSPYPEGLARWLELDYHRRPRPLRRIRKWVTLGFVLASLLYVAWTVLPSHHAAHQAAPVATGHALFNVSCEKCHTESFQPLARLAHGDEVRPPRPDEIAGKPFFATGVSLVMHPKNPFVPIVHMVEIPYELPSCTSVSYQTNWPSVASTVPQRQNAAGLSERPHLKPMR